MATELRINGFKVVVSPLLAREPKIKCGPIPYAEDVVAAFNVWLGDRFGWVHPCYVMDDTMFVGPDQMAQLKMTIGESSNART